MRFSKEHQKGFRLENTPGKVAPTPIPGDDFMALLDLKFNANLPIVQDLRNYQKELLPKYLPLYDLKMTSQMEEIDNRYSFVDVAKD